MPTPNADDPLRTTDHAPAPHPAMPAETVTHDSRPAPAGRDASAPPAGQATVTFRTKPGESQDSPSAAPYAPPSIPGYKIEAVLGRGGMGVVYKARHLALKRTVALKMVLAGGHAGPGELARFRIEAEAVARMQHPNIVQIHDVGEAGGHPYCALEFVEGGNLAGKLGGKPLRPREAALLVESLARAMQLAHSRSVVHRDLKPANVLLTADGTPKITDFGLARQLDADSAETQAGAVLGTPSYMAPEQASGRAHEAGPAVDVYALGAILYESLAGRPPFKGSTIVETLDQVRTQEPVPPSRIQAKVPFDLETICLKAMAKEPARRYPTAGDLGEDLRRFLNDEPILARRVGVTEKLWRRVRRNPALVGLTAALVVLGAIVAFVATRPRPEAPTAMLATETDTSADDLLKVVAELDRTDPDWRLEAMQRKRPVYPADENGATQIGKFQKAVAQMTGRPKSEGNWTLNSPFPQIYERIAADLALPPNAPLPAAEVKTFREELTRVESLLPLARKMIDYPRGRFATTQSRDVVSTLIPEHAAGANLVRLLALDALMQLQDGNREQAVSDCRAMWNVGRAYLDEPMVIVQLMRIVVIRMTLRVIERMLAHGDCTDADLPAFQQLIEEATRVQVFATIMRGDRGTSHYFLSSLAAGDVPNQSILELLGIKDRSQLPAAKDIRRIHAWLLGYATEGVEIANQPPEQWAALLKPYDEKRSSAPLTGHPLVEMFTTDMFDQSRGKHSMASGQAAAVTHHIADLRSAQTALAAERYRLARGEWPRDLAALVPTYLKEVPTDPYDGKPVRYRRTSDGVVVYCLGPDRTDNEGKLERTNSMTEGMDIGFQLWDVGSRR
jgi:hypothetical protein